MTQPSSKSDRVRGNEIALIVDRRKNGVVVAGRLPATQDPWAVGAHWGLPKGPGSDVLVRVEYRPSPAGPQDVVVYALADALAVRVPLLPSGDGVAPARVEVHRRDGSPPGQADFAQLGLRAVYDAMVEALRNPVAVEHLGERWGAVETPRPGQRGRPELFYAKVALDYVRARQKAPDTPIRAMVEAARAAGEHATEDELRARLRRARARKLLTAAPRGKAGGELTPKARKLLAAAGIGEGEL